MSGLASRRKGVKGEREIAALYEARGLDVRGLEASGDHLVVCDPESGLTLHSEVKRQERLRLPEWIAQAEAEAPAGTLAAVHFRQNRGRWYVVLRAEQFADVLAARGLRP